MASNTFFTKKGNDIIFTGEYLEAYIPQLYYERGLCEEYGETKKVLGIFNLRSFGSKDKKNPSRLFTLNIPTLIETYPTSIEGCNLDILGTGSEEPYVIYKYFNGDVFTNTFIKQSASNCELFLKLLTGGKVPNTIPYKDVINLWRRNLDINGVGMKEVPATIFELVIAEIYRDAESPENRFSKRIGSNPKTSQYAYQTADTRSICKYNSTFAGISFENINEMLISGLNVNKSKRKETESPIEKIMKY